VITNSLIYALVLPLIGGSLGCLLHHFSPSSYWAGLVPVVMVPTTYLGVRGFPALPPMGAGEWLFFGILVCLVYPILVSTFPEWSGWIFSAVSLVILLAMAEPSRALGMIGPVTVLGFFIPIHLLYYGLNAVKAKFTPGVSFSLLLSTGGGALLVGYFHSFFAGQLIAATAFSVLPLLLLVSLGIVPLPDSLIGSFLLISLGTFLFVSLFTGLSTYVCLIILLSPLVSYVGTHVPFVNSSLGHAVVSVLLTLILLVGALGLTQPELLGLSTPDPESKNGAYRPYQY
jgi:hypothetical protein